MSIQGKVWGITECLFSINNVEIHRIVVNKGGYCSKHEHKSKSNLFYVESGQLEVIIFRDDELVPDDRTILNQGQMSVVKPGEKHRFRALQDTVAYEVYWSELDPDDITRYSKGGNEAR